MTVVAQKKSQEANRLSSTGSVLDPQLSLIVSQQQ